MPQYADAHFRRSFDYIYIAILARSLKMKWVLFTWRSFEKNMFLFLKSNVTETNFTLNDVDDVGTRFFDPDVLM